MGGLGSPTIGTGIDKRATRTIPTVPSSPEAYEANRMASATHAQMLSVALQLNTSTQAPPPGANPLLTSKTQGLKPGSPLTPPAAGGAQEEQAIEEAIAAADTAEGVPVIANGGTGVYSPSTTTSGEGGYSTFQKALFVAALVGGGYVLYRIVS